MLEGVSLLEDVSSQLLKKSTAVHAVGIAMSWLRRLAAASCADLIPVTLPTCCYGMSRLAKKGILG